MDAGEKSKPSLLSSIPLIEAVLCADCEMISDSAGENCLVCGSRSLLSIARVLGGSAGRERAVMVHLEAAQLRNAFTVLVNPEAARVLKERRRRKQMPLFEQLGG